MAEGSGGFTRVLLTGATGAMGSAALPELLSNPALFVTAFVRDGKAERVSMARQLKAIGQTSERVRVLYGDLASFDDACLAVQGQDVVLHCAALVSPAADYHPQLAMRVNYGATVNLLEAVKRQPHADEVRFVYIGTVAETGDRLPPIQWGRVGDPIKPSVHDYYAVSKVAAERAVIESGLARWVSLRQTGMFSMNMARVMDGIIFHNCLDNPLEYVSDKDSGVILRRCCEDVPERFWRHVYNVGGGDSCRLSGYGLMQEMLGRLGIADISLVFDRNWFALRNFHGQFYLDGDRLNNFLGFRSMGKDYFFECYEKALGAKAGAVRALTAFPGGQKAAARIMRAMFKALVHGEHGTLGWIESNREDYIRPFFISKERWERIGGWESYEEPANLFKPCQGLDHGFDESKPEAELSLRDVRGAAEFRGGKLLSRRMVQGDWTTPLTWRCSFGHEFDASPRLVLEGGHWCPVCERTSWNYGNIAKANPFFAQVWYPLHDEDEPPVEYPKLVTELDVDVLAGA